MDRQGRMVLSFQIETHKEHQGKVLSVGRSLSINKTKQGKKVVGHVAKHGSQ